MLGRVLLSCCLLVLAWADPQIDPYEVLELKKANNPSAADIKKAYRRLSLKYHPDKTTEPDAKQKMAQISSAYEMIGDPDKKVIFDEFGTDEKYYSKWHYEQAQRQKGKGVSTKGFYENSDEVKALNSKTFWPFSRAAPALVNFYAPWCTHCQQMITEYKKTGILLEDIAKVGSVNCEAEQALCGQYGINGYPTLMLFLKSGEMETYQGGEHTADAIYSWVQQAQSNNVLSLSSSTMKYLNNGSLWLVDFSAGAWCGPCTSLKPVLRRVATEVRDIAKVAIVDCDNNPVCGQYEVQYYPQLRLFFKGKTPPLGETWEVNQQFPAAGALELFSKITRLLLGTQPEPQTEAEHGEPEHGEPVEGHSDL